MKNVDNAQFLLHNLLRDTPFQFGQPLNEQETAQGVLALYNDRQMTISEIEVRTGLDYDTISKIIAADRRRRIERIHSLR